VKIFKILPAVSIKNIALWGMAICSVVESNEDFEEVNFSHTEVSIVKVLQNVPLTCS